MPLSRRRAFAPRGRVSPRRKVVWATASAGNVSVLTGANITPIDLLGDLETSGASVLGATVVRLRLRVSLSALSTDTGPGVTYGVIVWDSTAGLPPATDFEDDWMINTFLDPGLSNSSIQVNGSSGSILYGETLDIRARRRLHQMHDHPFFVMKNDGSATQQFSMFCKTLIMLP